MTLNEIIGNTPANYLMKVLASRNPGPDARGSQFAEEISPVDLAKAQWEPYPHPAIEAPAQGFKAKIPGYVGVIAIAPMQHDAELVVVKAFKEDLVEVVVRQVEFGPYCAYSTALVGPSREEPEKLVLWTVFPGDPIAPTAKNIEGILGPITKQQALDFGFEYAKLEMIPDLPILSARIEQDKTLRYGSAQVWIKLLENGPEERLFSYFDDELHFSPEEFVGLTREAAHALFHKKNIAHIRS